VQAVAGTHDTASRSLACEPRFGVCTTDQVDESLCTALWGNAGPLEANAGARTGI
jgi:hypothetical protein